MIDIIENMFFRHNPKNLGINNKGIIIKFLHIQMDIPRVGEIMEQQYSYTLLL